MVSLALHKKGFWGVKRSSKPSWGQFIECGVHLHMFLILLLLEWIPSPSLLLAHQNPTRKWCGVAAPLVGEWIGIVIGLVVHASH